MKIRFLALGALLSVASTARAEPDAGTIPLGPSDRLTFRAGKLDADPNLRELTLRDGVELRYGRYRLTGEALRLQLEGGGIRFDGDARFALCSCADPPIAFAVSGGRLDPPGDLIVRFPRVLLLGVPVFALPVLWLRSPDLPGLLAPSLSVRGADGVLLGAGAHLPLAGHGASLSSLDVTGAGYFQGGAEATVRLTTPETSARLVIDEIHGDRVAFEARGAIAPAAGEAIAWEADALRGDRARRGTVDLAAAALPFDHAAAEASLRGPAGAILAAGAVASAIRGEGPIALGPSFQAAAGGSLGSHGTWSGRAGGVALGNALSAGALPIGHAALDAALDARPGPLRLRLDLGGRAAVAGDDPAAASTDLAAGARLAAELPLQRAFAAAPGDPPWVHRIAPVAEIAFAALRRQGRFFDALSAAPPPALGLAAAGLSTSLGRSRGPAARLDVRAGTLATISGAAGLIAGRLTVDATALGLSVEGAAAGFGQIPSGSALIGRARLGPPAGPSLRADVAAQAGAGAREARALAGWRGGAPGGELGYLAARGLTGGAELGIPWFRVLTTTVRADADLGSPALLGLRAAAEYRDPCGCFALGLAGAHRVGREGLDVVFSIDLAPAAPLVR